MPPAPTTAFTKGERRSQCLSRPLHSGENKSKVFALDMSASPWEHQCWTITEDGVAHRLSPDYRR
jgi:hypothetical protein